MKNDFDNGMGLPEDELAGSAMSDSGDLGLGGMDAEDEIDSEAPGRPSGGARARSSSPRPSKRAAMPARKAAKGAKKKKSAGAAKKKGPKKAARKASRKPARKATKKAGGRKRKAGRKR